ncbi:unnamed protein product [Gulo gulo]|uniref:Uncharacterized protein n=1 Tax=Gulo gulo TaxID=48420 RepID=A0A9X9LJG4_GULGU|nr:unnamed protein product [Gulo gulo]
MHSDAAAASAGGGAAHARLGGAAGPRAPWCSSPRSSGCGAGSLTATGGYRRCCDMRGTSAEGRTGATGWRCGR